MTPSKTFQIEIPEHLARVLCFFEVNCVADCCGLCAFEFKTVYACHAMAEHGGHELEQCVNETDTILTELQAIPEGWSVSSERLNVMWPRAEALTFFEMLKDLFQEALTIGLVPRDGPHSSSELS